MPLLYSIKTFFNTCLPIFLKVLNIIFLFIGFIGLRSNTPPKAIINFLAKVKTFTGCLADRIIISGCKGVKILFYKSASHKGIGWALWRASKYKGNNWIPGR